MNNLYFRQLKISFFRSGNELIYYLSKFPVIKKYVKDSWYSNSDVKLVLAVIRKLRSLCISFILGALSLFFTVLFPVLVLDDISAVKDDISVLFHIVFWVYCIFGAFAHRAVAASSSDRNEYIMLHVMHTPAREYYVMKLFKRLLRTFADFFPLIFFGGFKAYLICCFYIICFRCIGEASALRLYTLWQNISRISQIIFVTGLLAAVGIGEIMCIVKLGSVHTYSVMTGAAGTVLTLAAAAVSLISLLKYKKYRMIAHELVSYDSVSLAENIKKDSKKNIRENLVMNSSDEKYLETSGAKYENKKGYEYLTAMFFSRHRHLFVKKVIIKSVGIFAAEAILALLAMFIPGFARTDNFMNTVSMAPAMLYWFYIFSSGQSICQALFYNCDRPMLKYGYYRRGRAVLENFRYRIRYVMLIDMIPSVLFCILPFELVIINGRYEYLMTAAVVVLGYIAASVFFSVFHMIMYYLFQPYTEDMHVHGKAYKFINAGLLIAMYFLYSSEGAGWTEHSIRMFFGIFAAVSVLFIPVSFLLVYRIAPKSFTLK